MKAGLVRAGGAAQRYTHIGPLGGYAHRVEVRREVREAVERRGAGSLGGPVGPRRTHVHLIADR